LEELFSVIATNEIESKEFEVHNMRVVHDAIVAAFECRPGSLKEVHLGDYAVHVGERFGECGFEASPAPPTARCPITGNSSLEEEFTLSCVRVQDATRLTVCIRFISPEETQTALTRLREHGATGYGGYSPPTATEVGFHDKDFVTLPEDLLELLLFLPDLQKLSFRSCRRMVLTTP
jgi:hypothetical protein